mmetsp:Transcript_3070/g.12433  ORF Transcript_3070/g.12433 Transcript_3070/m.12433 type:complete len:279 (-) Transcript_3070:375-1211(-)
MRQPLGRDDDLVHVGVQIARANAVHDSLRVLKRRLLRHLLDLLEHSVVELPEVSGVAHLVGDPQDRIGRGERVGDHELDGLGLLVRVDAAVERGTRVEELVDVVCLGGLPTHLAPDDLDLLHKPAEIAARLHTRVEAVPHHVVELVHVYAVAPIGDELAQETLVTPLVPAVGPYHVHLRAHYHLLHAIQRVLVDVDVVFVHQQIQDVARHLLVDEPPLREADRWQELVVEHMRERTVPKVVDEAGKAHDLDVVKSDVERLLPNLDAPHKHVAEVRDAQ